MDLINKNDVKTIGSIGAGPIGAGWVAYFLSQGLSVKAYPVSYTHLTLPTKA